MVAVMALSMTVPFLYSIVLDTVPVLEPRIDKSRKHLLKQHGGMHHLHVLEFSSDNVQADRQSLVIQPTGEGGCGLLSEVEGVAEGGPFHPVVISPLRRYVVAGSER